jgi:hypothetical protein
MSMLYIQSTLTSLQVLLLTQVWPSLNLPHVVTKSHHNLNHEEHPPLLIVALLSIFAQGANLNPGDVRQSLAIPSPPPSAINIG